MAKQIPEQDLIEIEEIVRRHPDGVTFKEIVDALKTRVPPRTLQYRLRYLVNEKRLVPERDRRWRKYRVRPARSRLNRKPQYLFLSPKPPSTSRNISYSLSRTASRSAT